MTGRNDATNSDESTTTPGRARKVARQAAPELTDKEYRKVNKAMLALFAESIPFDVDRAAKTGFFALEDSRTGALVNVENTADVKRIAKGLIAGFKGWLKNERIA
jgi:hypothetical protein